MSQRYQVTHVPHFIGGRLVYPDAGADSIVTLPAGVKPGRWLKPVEEVKQEQAMDGGAAKYAAVHISRGDYVVELIENGSRASVVFKNTGVQGEAKDLAEAEAARLNAGGEVQLEEQEQAPDAGSGGDGNASLPDA